MLAVPPKRGSGPDAATPPEKACGIVVDVVFDVQHDAGRDAPGEIEAFITCGAGCEGQPRTRCRRLSAAALVGGPEAQHRGDRKNLWA